MRISDWSSDVCSSDLIRNDFQTLFVLSTPHRTLEAMPTHAEFSTWHGVSISRTAKEMISGVRATNSLAKSQCLKVTWKSGQSTRIGPRVGCEQVSGTLMWISGFKSGLERKRAVEE